MAMNVVNPPLAAERSNANKWLSRSFWLLLIFGLLGFVLSWQLTNVVAFTTVVSVGLAGWFGGKMVQRQGP